MFCFIITAGSRTGQKRMIRYYIWKVCSPGTSLRGLKPTTTPDLRTTRFRPRIKSLSRDCTTKDTSAIVNTKPIAMTVCTEDIFRFPYLLHLEEEMFKIIWMNHPTRMQTFKVLCAKEPPANRVLLPFQFLFYCYNQKFTSGLQFKKKSRHKYRSQQHRMSKSVG